MDKISANPIDWYSVIPTDWKPDWCQRRCSLRYQIPLVQAWTAFSRTLRAALARENDLRGLRLRPFCGHNVFQPVHVVLSTSCFPLVPTSPWHLHHSCRQWFGKILTWMRCSCLQGLGTIRFVRGNADRFRDHVGMSTCPIYPTFVWMGRYHLYRWYKYFLWFKINEYRECFQIVAVAVPYAGVHSPMYWVSLSPGVFQHDQDLVTLRICICW